MKIAIRILITRLRKAGHDVKCVTDCAKGAKDADILGLAIEDNRVLLTNDLDFGLLSERAGHRPFSIILMRLDPLRAAARADIVAAFLEAAGDDCLGKFYVIEPGNIRERNFNQQQ